MLLILFQLKSLSTSLVPCHALSFFPLLHINPRPTWRRLGCLVEKLGPQAGKLQLGMWQVRGARWAKWIESQWIPWLLSCLKVSIFLRPGWRTMLAEPWWGQNLLGWTSASRKCFVLCSEYRRDQMVEEAMGRTVTLIIKRVVPTAGSNRFFLSSVDQAVSTKLVLAESRNWDTSVGLCGKI